MHPFNRNQLPDRLMGSGEKPSMGSLAKLGFAVVLETGMAVLLYGTYSKSMDIGDSIYLADLPGVGGVFAAIDDEATVTHLLAFLLAVFCISVPIMLWSEIIKDRIHEDVQAWLAEPINRTKAIVAGCVLGAVAALEIVNLYTLIAQEAVVGPFAQAQSSNGLMQFLGQNQGLGIFVAVLITLVNILLALLTVRAVHAVQNEREG